MTVKLSGYQTGKLIYTGTRTLVYQGQRESDGQPVIIKLLRHEYPSFSELVQFRNQYTIMLRIADANAKNLNLPGIIRPYSLEPYRNSYALVMEDCGSISLNHCDPLTLEDILSIAIQLAEILHELHQNRVIHKDIKPANILIHPESKQVKLIDFSIASLLPKETQEIKNPNGLEGTLAYISPEQTGRMNRGIDYRSDFYSLGVTLFELLTGQLPFQSNDLMELVHCHIAKIPKQLKIKNAKLKNSNPLSDIVMKLMAKNAEDRYQSALGLKHDLETCLEQLKATGKIEAFEIGKRDLCDRFIIPEKLYGRETEVQTLLAAFERVANGTSELMLVSGFSGIGKTAVVNEVHKPITRQNGYFIKGKFDQFNRNIPFSAFVQAFRDLMGQLLCESDTQLQTWKTQILEALGDNAQVVIEVIPELERIIGVQPPAPELSGTAAKNRFNLLLEKFIQVFTTKEHPLVMFLDDLQWADSASLKLMQLLMEESQTGYLLLIGAYRDNEVFAAHPLILTLDEVGKAGATVNTIILEPLSNTSLNQLVADTLNCTEEFAQPLTELLYQKTKGNPFFATQFLKALHQDQLITFNVSSAVWQCHITQVREAALTDDVVELMTQQLQKLSAPTQEVLKLAACIGNQFDLATLAIVSEQSESEAADALWKALQEGLVIPQSETYKFFQGSDSESSDSEKPTLRDRRSEIIISYKFLHDRVQQAAYSLIPKEQKQITHLSMGQLLLRDSSPSEQEERLFEIVNHLNIGIAWITQPQERQHLAQLNLAAGRKAKTATAYGAVYDHLAIGIELLPGDAWESDYDLTLALHEGIAEASYLNTDFEQIERWAGVVLQQAKTLLDTIKVQQTRIMGINTQGRSLEAIQIGLSVLHTLGIEFPEQPNPENIEQAFGVTRSLWTDKAPSRLLDLPTMHDSKLLAVMEILTALVPVAYAVAPTLMLLLIFKQVELSLQFGNCPTSIFAYSEYGLILCAIIGDIENGYEFGELALNLRERLQLTSLKSRNWFVVHTFIKHWKIHLPEVLPELQEAYRSGLETGDIDVGCQNARIYCHYAYHAGQELAELALTMEAYRQTIHQYKQARTLDAHEIYQQIVQNLLGQVEVPYCLTGEVFDQERSLPQLQAANQLATLFIWYMNQAFLYYLFGQERDAAQTSAETAQYLDSGMGLFMVPLYFFFDALIQLTQYPTASPEERQVILSQVQQHQDKLQNWAALAPGNHQHRWELVAAEQYRVLGNKTDAIEHYERAITSAKANNFIQDEALANELAAKFYLEWGKEKVASGYMQEAYYCYAKWGAKAKTDDLENRYRELLRPIWQQAIQTLNPLEILVSRTASSFSIHTSTKNSQYSSTNLNTALDFAAVLKASQSLSSTIKLDELLHQLTQIILQNSGADHCALILPNSDEKWQVQAIATPEKTELCSKPLENNPHLPLKLIQYVKNTQKIVVFDHLKTDLPVICEYLNQRNSKSILCLPILSQGELRGILYLKNRSTAGVFTQDRLLILNFLCTQAAISLENARLYQQAQDYAQQLEQSQLQLIQSEKMSALGNLVAGVAHEINNPVGFIAGNLQPAQDYVKDLLGLLDLYAEEYPQPTEIIEEEIEAIDLDFIRKDLPKLIGSMKEGTDRISHISTSLRTFSRTDRDRPTLFNIHDGIDSTLLILKHRLKANEKRPEIKVIKTYGKLPQIHCFAGQLNQVFMNLIANAIDAIDEGCDQGEITKPYIQIQTEVLDNSVVIRIQDNALGMTEEVKSRIFDHLFTTKSVGKGTGLGLAIAHQIVEDKHDGSLEVQSEVDRGTEFCIRLPIAE